jgi:putative oxidoreductase
MPKQLPLALLLLRLGIFVVFLFWTLDKLVQPEHAAKVFGAFYGLGGLGETAFYIIGAAQLMLVLLFVTGLFKTCTYGAILVFHSFSTLSAFAKYLQPFDNLLFFAAWPMLAACAALFLLRDYDTLTLSRQPVPAKA